MNLYPCSERAGRFPALRLFGLAGRGLLLAFLLIVAPLSSQAGEMRVADGAAGIYQVAGGRGPEARAGNGQPAFDTTLITGAGSVLGVVFPNGMNWQLTENSRLWLQSFTYEGTPLTTEYNATLWSERSLLDQEEYTIRERGPSIWTARLDYGSFMLGGLRPERRSRHIVDTKEARLDLRAVSASIRRNDTDGTILNVFSGEAKVTLKDGRTYTVDTRSRITISPSGVVNQGRAEPGVALVPARPGRSFVSFNGLPRAGIPDSLPPTPIIVSPSS